MKPRLPGWARSLTVRSGPLRMPNVLRATLLDIARLAVDATTGALAWTSACLLVSPHLPAQVGLLGSAGAAAAAATVGGLLPAVRRARWRYFGFADLSGILRAAAVATLLTAAGVGVIWWRGGLSLSPVKALLLFPVLTCTGLVATRTLRRWTSARGASPQSPEAPACPTFFLLRAKCPMVSRDLAVPQGSWIVKRGPKPREGWPSDDRSGRED